MSQAISVQSSQSSWQDSSLEEKVVDYSLLKIKEFFNDFFDTHISIPQFINNDLKGYFSIRVNTQLQNELTCKVNAVYQRMSNSLKTLLSTHEKPIELLVFPMSQGKDLPYDYFYDSFLWPAYKAAQIVEKMEAKMAQAVGSEAPGANLQHANNQSRDRNASLSELYKKRVEKRSNAVINHNNEVFQALQKLAPRPTESCVLPSQSSALFSDTSFSSSQLDSGSFPYKSDQNWHRFLWSYVIETS